jgi:hypothetical protein
MGTTFRHNVQHNSLERSIDTIMLSFKQWLNERGVRTGLGIYPPLYSSGQNAPLYYAPIAGGASLAMDTIHRHHPECYKKKRKKKKK